MYLSPIASSLRRLSSGEELSHPKFAPLRSSFGNSERSMSVTMCGNASSAWSFEPNVKESPRKTTFSPSSWKSSASQRQRIRSEFWPLGGTLKSSQWSGFLT